jgi:hypothetical protein
MSNSSWTAKSAQEKIKHFLKSVRERERDANDQSGSDTEDSEGRNGENPSAYVERALTDLGRGSDGGI